MWDGICRCGGHLPIARIKKTEVIEKKVDLPLQNAMDDLSSPRVSPTLVQPLLLLRSVGIVFNPAAPA
jgi:hypothetical protein